MGRRLYDNNTILNIISSTIKRQRRAALCTNISLRVYTLQTCFTHDKGVTF